MHPADAVVLVVWTPIAVQLARGGSLLAAVPNEGEMDEEESAAAQRIADEGARAPGGAATTPLRVSRRRTSRWPRRSWVARQIDARLIVCGPTRRGDSQRRPRQRLAPTLRACRTPVLIAPSTPLGSRPTRGSRRGSEAGCRAIGYPSRSGELPARGGGRVPTRRVWVAAAAAASRWSA